MTSNANGTGHANGIENATAGDGSNNIDVSTFWDRYDFLKLNDGMKNLLLEDVITRYGNLIQTHNEYVAAHQQEREYAKSFLEREQVLRYNVNHLQYLLNRDPYILVLIDGDGMIFNSTFLNQGEAGGKNAAAKLYNAVMEWALSHVAECPADVKVVVRVYANVKGLGEVCARAGIVDHAIRVEEFVRGFTCGKTLFDFTDVGAGKDRADSKIEETFKLYIFNFHCRQILFGCSHDNGFARLLEQYTEEQGLRRVTLLEGVPFEKELNALPFRKQKFPGMFRENKIVAPGQVDLLTGSRSRNDSRMSLNATSGVFTPRTGTPASLYNPVGGISNLDGQAMGMGNLHIRDDSFTSTAASSDTGGGTWATVVSKNAHRPPANMVRSPANPPKENPIKRNRAGQRVDEHMDYERDEVQRIKRMKACNQHYIGVGCCHYDAGKADKCPHSHHYKFSQADLKTLRVVARETPCKKGHTCDDPKCIYGHQCPFPVATEGSMRGIGCLNGDACRFPRTMHGMDTQQVKTFRAVGMF